MSLSMRSAIRGEVTPLSAALDRARASGRPLIDLSQSNPTLVELAYDAYQPVLAWSLAEGRELWASYTPEALGLADARRAIARHWPQPGDAEPAPAACGKGLDPERLLVVSSSSEAYSYLLTLLCDAGDEVLIPCPSYPLLAHLGHYAGVRLVPYRLAYDGAWHIDFDSVRRALSVRSRAIVLVNPNNPTGSYVKRDELSRLAELGLPLIVDEVFARFELSADPTRTLSALGASEALTFCIDGLSKSAGLPQLKLSWVALSGPDRQVQESRLRLEWLADTYLSAATPTQRALPQLLDAARTFRRSLRRRLQENHATLAQMLEGSAASLLRVEGGWYAVVQLPDVASEDEWVLGLLEREHTIVQPGYFYDFERSPFLVLSLLPHPAEFQRGVSALVREVQRAS